MVRARHGDYFLMMAEEVKPKLGGSEQAQWLAVLEEEHDNLRQALTFYMEDTEGAQAGEKGLRLAAALQRFWSTRGHLSEGRERFGVLLAHPKGQERTKARADALNSAGTLAWMQGDYAAARILLEQSLELFRELGNKGGIALSLINLGTVAKEEGEYAEARVLLEQSLAIRRELRDKQGIAVSLLNLGTQLVEQSDYPAACACLHECLTLCRELSLKPVTVYAVEGCAGLALRQQQPEQALRLWGAAAALRETIGSPLPPAAQEQHEREMMAVRETLGEDAFAAAWAKGQAMTMEQAIEYALSEPEVTAT
jgi:tetratricopeptide (TPR) repeat protein